jgi:hypothetical protein
LNLPPSLKGKSVPITLAQPSPMSPGMMGWGVPASIHAVLGLWLRRLFLCCMWTPPVRMMKEMDSLDFNHEIPCHPGFL